MSATAASKGRSLRILIVCQYYLPETAGPSVWLRELCWTLRDKGHDVSIATAFPNYPERVIHDAYKGKWVQTEKMDGITVYRSYIYANPSQSSKSKLLNWGSFCASTLVATVLRAKRPDVIYAILPPLPLGVSSLWIGALKGAPVVTNVQDIYPDAAIELGFLKNQRLIRFFKRMEQKVYRKSKHIVVISNGFRDNLRGKGVPSDKLTVVRNWADPDFIQPGPRMNSFREELGLSEDQFLVLYSGGLTYNADLSTLIQIANALRDRKDIHFAIVGDGVRKQELIDEAKKLDLENVSFKPFQPLERYPEVLRSCDLSVVTLNAQATMVSVPSKVFKQMAAGRAVLGLADPASELGRMISEADCGACVVSGDLDAAVKLITDLASDRSRCAKMGENSREYLVNECAMGRCIDTIESVLLDVAK